jgi:hypothetical protein
MSVPKTTTSHFSRGQVLAVVELKCRKQFTAMIAESHDAAGSRDMM